jgi:hypothetical protein
MTNEIQYEYKTVQTVRGTDGLVTSKMQKGAWELVEQSPGMLRSTLTFRRPKKPLPWPVIGTVAAGIVVLTAVIGTAAVLRHRFLWLRSVLFTDRVECRCGVRASGHELRPCCLGRRETGG